MKLIFKSMGEGKTYDAIKLANETDAYLAVATRADVRRVTREYPIKPNRFPLTYAELMSVKGQGIYPEARAVVIDDVERLLQELLPYFAIKGVTMNKPNGGTNAEVD